MQLRDDAIARLLESWPIAHLASTAPDGRPHQVPIVFAQSGGRLWSPVDGKPKRGGELARVANIRARPEVSLLLDDYNTDWTQLWWIRVDASAEVVQPESLDDPEVSAAIAALETKYPQYSSVPLLRERPAYCEPPDASAR